MIALSKMVKIIIIYVQRIMTGKLKLRTQKIHSNKYIFNLFFKISNDLEISSIKAKKSKELESKVDMVLKHNSKLLGDNSQLQKFLN